MPDGEIQQALVAKTAIRVEMRFLLREPVEIAASNSPIAGIDRGIAHQVAASGEMLRPPRSSLWITLDKSVLTG